MSSNTGTPGGEVVLFEAPDGGVQVEVRLERETVWLSLSQMAELFGRDKSVISRHLRNVFQSGELERGSVVAKNATTATDGKTYQVEFFNLDAIISVGYRVNSKRGTQFRIWATRLLRQHLLRGYTLNQQRLEERGLEEVSRAVGLLSRTLSSRALVTDEGRAVLGLVEQYARAWRLLHEYDERRLPHVPGRPVAPRAHLSAEHAHSAVDSLRNDLIERGEAGQLFGREQGEGLGRILGAIEQTFGGEALYPSGQARAAHLLYFLIKDHPFADGNKRIGTLLFLEYLRMNGLLFRPDGRPLFPDNAMVALALLIAESDPSEKDLIIRLVLNLLDCESVP